MPRTISKEGLYLNYFQGCKTIHEAKARFRELAKKHHPDAGGDAKIFAEISNQMDAFMPSQPEHTNYYGKYSESNPKSDFEDAFNRAYKAYTFYGQSAYTFNTNNRNSTHNYSIPFDHPIHEELRNALNNCTIYRIEIQKLKQEIDELKEMLKNSNQFLYHKNKECSKKEEEIDSLKSQIEVLSRPQPSCSMLDKIRSYFEKSS